MEGKKKLPEGMKSLGQDEEYDKEVRSRLKGSSSPRRVEAQRIRRLKEMSSQQLEERGLEILGSPQKFDLELLYLIQEMLKKDLPDKQKLDLIQKMVQVKGAVWGTKSSNVNVNVETTANEVIERLREWKKQQVFEIPAVQKEISSFANLGTAKHMNEIYELFKKKRLENEEKQKVEPTSRFDEVKKTEEPKQEEEIYEEI